MTRIETANVNEAISVTEQQIEMVKRKLREVITNTGVEPSMFTQFVCLFEEHLTRSIKEGELDEHLQAKGEEDYVVEAARYLGSLAAVIGCQSILRELALMHKAQTESN